MKLLVVLLLLFPCVAMAADKCCFVGPGDCYVINSASKMENCENNPNTLTLSSPCNEAPECMLSEEPVVQPPEPKSEHIRGNATFTNVSGKARTE